MHAQLARRLAHGIGCQQAIGIRQPASLVAQAGQRRAAERIEGAPARYAAVALQPVGVAMAVTVCGLAGGTVQALPGHAFDQCHGGIRRCGPMQQGDTGQALALAQIGKLGNKTFPFGCLHEALPSGWSTQLDLGRTVSSPTFFKQKTAYEIVM